MKIAFSKLNAVAYPFKLNLENVVFEGELKRKNAKLAEVLMSMKGFVYRVCDSCGREMELSIDEKIKLLASDGIYKDENGTLSDVVEFYDAQIDLIELALGELESHLSGYFYCSECEIQHKG